MAKSLSVKIFHYCLFSFFRSFGPVTGLYAGLMLARGLTPWQISTAFFVGNGVALLLEIPSGTFADRISYRRALLLSQIVRSLAYATLLIAPTYLGFIVAMALLSAKESLISGSTESLLFSILKSETSQQEYTRFLGYEAIFNRCALLLSSIVGTLLYSLGLETLVFATMGASCMATCAAFFLPLNQVKKKVKTQSTLTLVRIGFRQVGRDRYVLGIVLFLGLVSGFDLWNYWVIFGKEAGLTPARLGLVMVGANFAGMVAGYLAPRLQKLSLPSVIALGFFGTLLFLLASITMTPFALWGVFCFLSLHYALGIVMQGRLQAALSESVRATVTSIPAFIASILCLGIDLLFGVLSSSLGYRVSFVTSSVMVLLLILGAWFWFRTNKAQPTRF